MVRRIWVLRAGAALLALSPVACSPSSTATATNTQATSAAAVDVGSPLYKGEKAEDIPLAGQFEEQIVIPNAVVRLDKKQTIHAQVDGQIVIIGTQLPQGAAVDPNAKDIAFDPQDKLKQAPYRRVRQGDRVTKGAYVTLLDDIDVLVQIEAAEKMKVASLTAIEASKSGAESIKKTLVLYKQSGASSVEVLNAEATYQRYVENIATSERDMAKADGDQRRAEVMRIKHRSASVVTGIITNIMREPGEYVKAGEPIMEVLSTEDVRVEGSLEAQYADSVRTGMRVSIEPTLPVGPDLRSGAIFHRLEVTGVAVTAHAGRPLIASASLDATATVWDAFPPAGKPKMQTRLPHPVGVRSIAATAGKGGKHFLATGGDDGKVRLWDVSNPDKIGDKPSAEFADAHAGAATALAFSPDGKYLASAAGREVFLWDVASAKKLYSLPSEHKDAVTTVRFTPQAKLVTAARDRAVRVWTVGEKSASVDRTIDHRKGNVDTLGVSAAGGRTLFDQEDGRIDVVSLADGQPLGSIQNAATGARFATLALFSPDDSFVLTAGGDGDMKGELQVWAAPRTGSRAAELRRLVTPYRSSPTCAAFGTDPANGFIVVGTQGGGVHLWPVSMLKKIGQERTGRVVSVIRTDAKTVKVRIEADDVAGDLGLLQDKATATIIIKPGDAAPAPAPLKAPGAVAVPQTLPPLPAGGVHPAGDIRPAGGVVLPTVVVPAGGIVIPQLPGPRN